MSSIAIVGMQWGDEGKGKVIDLLSEMAQHIVRAQGGNNAGHTVIARGVEYRFHLIPSGIIYPHTKCYIGGGTVIDPGALLLEFEALRKNGISFEGRLFLSPYAHLVFPWHKLIDKLSEAAKGKDAVGTTGRGIGPCFTDKAMRSGMRIAELFGSHFPEKLKRLSSCKNQEMHKMYGEAPVEFSTLLEEFLGYREQLKSFVQPVEEALFAALKKGDRVLLEGAQGAMLDVGFGTYPFVTSSCTLAGGLSSGAGIGPSLIDQTIGVVKAYTTRVGNGPLPTELSAEELEGFLEHSVARELGTTTGRKRRIGWLDTFLLRHTVALNGADSLALTKLDVLDALEEIRICVGYKGFSHFPVCEEELARAVPVYEMHPGWKRSTKGVEAYDDLPPQAKAYVRRIEELCGLPISLISVGPEREKTLWLDRFFE